jgi:NAD(P)-dependent dehydrogenase (short-subunit alcohol dehydrogenase family)
VDLRLSGQVAVVTGASRGIGLAVTQALVAEGVCVAAGARTSTPELDALVASGSVVSVLADLTTRAGSEELVEAAVRTFGGLHVLVNNVSGVRPRPDGFLAVDDAMLQWSLEVNYLAAVRTTRAALPHLDPRPGRRARTGRGRRPGGRRDGHGSVHPPRRGGRPRRHARQPRRRQRDRH